MKSLNVGQTKISSTTRAANAPDDFTNFQYGHSDSVRPKPGLGKYTEPKLRSNFGIGIGAKLFFSEIETFFSHFSHFLGEYKFNKLEKNLNLQK